MAAKRAGYTISSYLLDISPSMEAEVEDAQIGAQVLGLELAKEYVSRKIAPKVGRVVVSVAEIGRRG